MKSTNPTILQALKKTLTSNFLTTSKMKFLKYAKRSKTWVLFVLNEMYLDSRDWKDRMEAMKKIQSIVVTTKITKFPNFIQSINKLHFPLTA